MHAQGNQQIKQGVGLDVDADFWLCLPILVVNCACSPESESNVFLRSLSTRRCFLLWFWFACIHADYLGFKCLQPQRMQRMENKTLTGMQARITENWHFGNHWMPQREKRPWQRGWTGLPVFERQQGNTCQYHDVVTRRISLIKWNRHERADHHQGPL